jgi:hypothetical protein
VDQRDGSTGPGIGERVVVKDPDSGRRIAMVIAVVTLVLFAALWLTIDSNAFSSVHGAP